MSQRENGFRGGIQKGMCATDAAARKLDEQCKTLKDKLAEEFPALQLQRKLTKDQIPGNKGACEPDGGVWLRDGKVVAVFEAKKQGTGGNAIERWFKNNYICRLINPDVCYVTFCSGEGARPDHVLEKTLNVAHLDGFNKFVENKNSCYLSEDGYNNEEVEKIMREVLEYVSA
jgi:hypothetical protein